MKTLELEVEEIDTADEVLKFLIDKKISEGDTLKIITEEVKSSVVLISILTLVAIAVVFCFYHEKKKRQEEGDKMLDDLFRGKTAEEIEKQIENEYGVKMVIEYRENDERTEWGTLSMQGLRHAYGDNEPDYSDADIKEPNPGYKKWRKAK